MRPRTLTLTPAQRADLERTRGRDRRPYLRERAAAVLKVAAGSTARQVALHGLPTARKPETLYRWLDAYERRGLAGLVQRPRGHRGFSPSAGRAGCGDGAPAA
jgi:hypothetical protein